MPCGTVFFKFMLPERYPPWETALTLDALFLHAAAEQLSNAQELETAVAGAQERIDKLYSREREILARYGGNEIDSYDELEPIWIAMEGAHLSLQYAQSPLIKCWTLTHILSSACMEAHINTTAKRERPAAEFDAFDKLTLEGKWRLLPRLLGKQGFDAGAEPFQTFAKLVRWRNALVHYKERVGQWAGWKLPEYLEPMGLTADAARAAYEAAKAMIARLCLVLGLPRPAWLDEEAWNYFESRLIKKRPK